MKDIFLVLDSYQYQMESSYQETSSLTNLFTENKFIGWLGLFIVFFQSLQLLFFNFLNGKVMTKIRNKKDLTYNNYKFFIKWQFT